MKIKTVSNAIAISSFLQQLDVDKGGRAILASKAKMEYIFIEALPVGGANILKQDALSIGADVAVPRGTIIAQTPYVDVLLIATKRHLEKLSKKLLAQPFGLQEVAKYLQNYLSYKQPAQKIMGIINANDDSFFSGSRFVGKNAIEKIEQMIEDGADIIDIGGVSSRPGSKGVSESEELERVQYIIDTIAKHKLYQNATFSIDSYTPMVISYALERGFKIVNDITGLADDRVCQLCSSYDATAVIMHMQGTPQTMQQNPHYEDVVDEVCHFFKQRIEKAKGFGVKDIVLDVGIGFGKTLQHNILLLRHLKHFQTLGYPLLVGASRKSMIDHITPSSVKKRLGGSIAIHLQALLEGANIVRVHDVLEVKQAWEVHKAIYG